MATGGGGASQVVSLPQGGGALQGIGEKFAPDLHTGTGNFTIPISLPPGRNGLQPTLSLSYSTGSGNGPFGLGWSLSVPGVNRQTSKGVPRYDDARDVFVLSGTEDLVPIPGAPSGATRYRPRTEGLFARITHHHDAGDDYWEVRTQDGLVSRYGTPGAVAANPAVVADPNDPTRIFGWKLTHTEDTFDNRIEYRYLRDEPPTGSLRRWDQLYLSDIRYVDYGNPDDPSFLVTVRFMYDERPDFFSDHRAGFEIRTTRRCTRIEVSTHADAERLLRTYDLTYLDQRGFASNELPPNGVSLLSRVQAVGHDGETTESLPPLDFGYTRFELRRRELFPVDGPDLPPSSLDNPDYELADLMGNGLPSVLEMNGAVRYWRNLGGRFDRPREMREAPAGVRLADPGVELLDANGDGRLDLLVTSGAHSGYFPLQLGGSWDRRSFRRYRLAPSFALDDPEVRLVDLDGDGVTDAIRSGARLECFFNDPDEGWIGARRVERRAPEDFPNVSFSDPRVRLADVTGDGLQDVVLVHDGGVEYWASLGRGDWGRRVSMANSPRFPFGYDPKRVLVNDVDGDGLADLVYVDDRKVTLWINQGGERWSDPIEIRGVPRVSDRDAVRLVDLLGNGVAGLLWSRDADGTRPSMVFLDFTGGTKPYLLNEMDNRMGAVTRLEYAPSTRFYLEDERRPETRWKTPLPFPVQVVARVEVIDQISGGKLTTEYTYHHGYWDGAEREFRGFGRVDQRDTEVFERSRMPGLHRADQAFQPVAQQMYSPPTETRTWFHQGAIDGEDGDWMELDNGAEYWPVDPPSLPRPSALDDLLRSLSRADRRAAIRSLRRRVLRTELYALDGSERQDRPFTVTESRYGLREESPPCPDENGRRRIFFPHLLAQRATQWERGEDAMTQLTFVDEYDAFGHPRSQITVAVPRHRDFRAPAPPGEPYLATQTVTDHAQRDDGRRLLAGRTARATTYEIVNDGSLGAFELRSAILAGAVQLRIVGQTLTFYDGPAFEGLPFGQVGDHGLASRTETLALTEEMLRETYATDGSPAIPPYLATNGPPPWTDDYPQEFRDRLSPLAGYVFRPGGLDSPHARGYFAVTERQRYDCQIVGDGRGRGLLLTTRDPLGRDTRVEYDAFELLPTQVTDAVGLTSAVVYDYLTFKPKETIDPNGNRTTYTFTPLGLLKSVAEMGKVGEAIGDTAETPGTEHVYDLMAFFERGRPASVRTVRRIHHVADADVPPEERDMTLESVAFTDGFGRALQTRVQAEEVVFGEGTVGDTGLPADQARPIGDAIGRRRADGPPWVVVSGGRTYDNKGRVVERYEPFFSTGFEYGPPTDDDLGEKVTIDYDPRGHPVRIVSPDGSERLTVHGTPRELATPDTYEPTPWEVYAYDRNDNAGRTHPTIGALQHYWDTPSSATVDALGRAIESVARNGPNAAADGFVTRSAYDVRGNLLTVVDAGGRSALQSIYDVTGRVWRSDSIDAGVRLTVFDAAGNELEARDGRGALILRAYDPKNRLSRIWARDGAAEAPTLRERVIYGDSEESRLSAVQASSANLLGRLVRHYDEAGLLTFDAYDFKGGVLEKLRRVIADEPILATIETASDSLFRVDWQPPLGVSFEVHADGLLESAVYRTSAKYDALGRITSLRYPADVEGRRRQLRPTYNRSGALERVEIDGAVFVEHVAYDPKGRRALIAYGNGVMTRYAYDPKTFRLTRMRSERFVKSTPLTCHPTGQPLQDLAYTHDLAGNVTGIRERTPGSGIPATPLGPDALDRTLDYDPIYRLVAASGRECDIPAERPPWDDRPRCVDLSRVRPYTERYEYDATGNLVRLQHFAVGGTFTRTLALATGSNRLATVTAGGATFDYEYDTSGDLIREGSSRRVAWDHAHRLRVFRVQVGAEQASIAAHYLYGADGRRVKKLVRKQGGAVEVTVYVDGLFEHRRAVRQGSTDQNNTLHVMDNERRIALLRVGAPLGDETGPSIQYHLSDHLASSNVVVDGSGALVNREEYSPYGETTFGSFARKRYRFSGKERDEESGFNYHEARYYAPWLGRWTSCDPAGMVDGPNLYAFVLANPINLTDASGRQVSQATQDALADLTRRIGEAQARLESALSGQAWGLVRSEVPSNVRSAITEARRAVAAAERELEGLAGELADLGRQVEQGIASSGMATRLSSRSYTGAAETALRGLRADIGSGDAIADDALRRLSRLLPSIRGGGGGGLGGGGRGGSGGGAGGSGSGAPSSSTPFSTTESGGLPRGSGAGSGSARGGVVVEEALETGAREAGLLRSVIRGAGTGLEVVGRAALVAGVVFMVSDAADGRWDRVFWGGVALAGGPAAPIAILALVAGDPTPMPTPPPYYDPHLEAAKAVGQYDSGGTVPGMGAMTGPGGFGRLGTEMCP